MNNTVTNTFYKYCGEKWVILQNGQNIVIAKSELVQNKADGIHIIEYKKETKIMEFEMSDVDLIFLKK